VNAIFKITVSLTFTIGIKLAKQLGFPATFIEDAFYIAVNLQNRKKQQRDNNINSMQARKNAMKLQFAYNIVQLYRHSTLLPDIISQEVRIMSENLRRDLAGHANGEDTSSIFP
jgi:hypothetical protein